LKNPAFDKKASLLYNFCELEIKEGGLKVQSMRLRFPSLNK